MPTSNEKEMLSSNEALKELTIDFIPYKALIWAANKTKAIIVVHNA